MGHPVYRGFGVQKKLAPPLLLRVKKGEGGGVGCCVGHAVLWALIGMKKVALGRSPLLTLWPLPLFPPIEFVASLRPICRQACLYWDITRFFSGLEFPPNSGDHLIFAHFTCIKITLDCINGGKEIFSDPMQFPTQLLLVLNCTYPDEFIGSPTWNSNQFGRERIVSGRYNIQKCRVASNPIWFEKRRRRKPKLRPSRVWFPLSLFWSCVQSQCRLDRPLILVFHSPHLEWKLWGRRVASVNRKGEVVNWDAEKIREGQYLHWGRSPFPLWPPPIRSDPIFLLEKRRIKEQQQKQQVGSKHKRRMH